MTETIRHVMQRMMLSDLELLKGHLETGIVSVGDPAQKKMIQTELLELIEGRKETIRKNEQKGPLLLMPKQKRNTRGGVERQI